MRRSLRRNRFGLVETTGFEHVTPACIASDIGTSVPGEPRPALLCMA